ncbi:MAG: IS3 family transposase [Paludibacteraceae bacterium]|nr:IS3 family transposase [Paludibacteraceae bacterium]
MQANKKERAEAIQGLRRTYRLDVLLELEGMAKSTFYYNLAAGRKSDPDAVLKKRIYQLYHKHKGRYGYRRITLSLRAEGIVVNHKKVERIMRDLGLKSTVRVVKYHSYKGEVGKVAPNLLERDFKADQPMKKLTTDISQVKIGTVKCFVSPVLDMYNGEIVAYDVSRRADLAQIRRMLKRLFRVGTTSIEGAILHSDQGWQYQNSVFVQALETHGIKQSMSKKGNCLDNAMMESFFGSMKSELLYLDKFDSMEQFELALKEYIHYYNHDRIKTRLKMSPVEYRLSHQPLNINPSNL